MLNPKLVVFDLDYTLWPFWCDTHVALPLRVGADARTIIDGDGDHFGFYDDVPDILCEICDTAGMDACVVSQTQSPRLAQSMLSMLEVAGRPASDFIYLTLWGTDTKLAHLQRLRETAGVAYEDMVFFDDEANSRDVERQLGVHFVQVTGGLTKALFEHGLSSWRARREQCLSTAVSPIIPVPSSPMSVVTRIEKAVS